MTALTPAQVRDHARALIETFGKEWDHADIVERLGRDDSLPPLTDEECDAAVTAIAKAAEAARITVDWDDPASPTQTDQEASDVPSDQ